MPHHDPRIDAYIAKSAEFARPILEHLRAAVHGVCPEVEETLKWSMPFFSYKGAPMCMRASFKQHCSFGFWLSREVTDGSDEDGMGQFGKLTSLKDLPSRKQLTTYISKAMALCEAGTHPAGRSGGAARPEETRRSAHNLCRLQPQRNARIRRLDRRGEDRRHPPETPRHRAGMAGRRQTAKLEIPEMLKAAS